MNTSKKTTKRAAKPSPELTKDEKDNVWQLLYNVLGSGGEGSWPSGLDVPKNIPEHKKHLHTALHKLGPDTDVGDDGDNDEDEIGDQVGLGGEIGPDVGPDAGDDQPGDDL